MTLQTEGYTLSAIGATEPPRDMMEAARMSLSAEYFARLMRRTDGRAPTPRELCEFADAERAERERLAITLRGDFVHGAGGATA